MTHLGRKMDGNGLERNEARDSSWQTIGGSSGCVSFSRVARSTWRFSGAGRSGPSSGLRRASLHNARMTDTIPVLTIDGPSGSGKGTISRVVAHRLGWHYRDSGALYRAVGVAAGWADLDLADPAALVRCTFDTEIRFRETADGDLRILVNGLDATDE